MAQSIPLKDKDGLKMKNIDVGWEYEHVRFHNWAFGLGPPVMKWN